MNSFDFLVGILYNIIEELGQAAPLNATTKGGDLRYESDMSTLRERSRGECQGD